MTQKKLSVEPYKGTRDFYPQDQFVQDYIFSVWRKVAQSYGYLEYGASILEETDLYRAKSGEEIVNEQTYSFTDRGDRDVTMRPEMTPTVARMVAQKRRELSFPLRWFSIPNLFRYERPQRGRLREHWQLNADIFGVDSFEADVEVIAMAYNMMKAFGAKDENFTIKINSRKLLNNLFDQYFKVTAEQKQKLFRLMDKFHKMERGEFERQTKEIVPEHAGDIMEFLFVKSEDQIWDAVQQHEGGTDLQKIFLGLAARGIKNFVFDSALVRGFDYYTGTIFEMYDTNPVNPRALFGGGRYDDLVGIFGVEKVSGVGFGWGDVTTRDFLETYNLLPEYIPSIDLYICHLEGYLDQSNQLAADLRKHGLNVAVDLSDRQVSKQVKTADKEKIPFVLVVGEEEVKSGKYKVKSLKESKEFVAALQEIKSLIKK